MKTKNIIKQLFALIIFFFLCGNSVFGVPFDYNGGSTTTSFSVLYELGLSLKPSWVSILLTYKFIVSVFISFFCLKTEIIADEFNANSDNYLVNSKEVKEIENSRSPDSFPLNLGTNSVGFSGFGLDPSTGLKKLKGRLTATVYRDKPRIPGNINSIATIILVG